MEFVVDAGVEDCVDDELDVTGADTGAFGPVLVLVALIVDPVELTCVFTVTLLLVLTDG